MSRVISGEPLTRTLRIPWRLMVTREEVQIVARKVARPVWRPVNGFERMGLAAGPLAIDLRLDRR
jgi:hypothetical protein